MDFENLPVKEYRGGWLAHLPGDDSWAFMGRTPEEARAKLSEYLNHLGSMMDLYSQFISKGDICFDVGANKGDRTAIFRRLGAKVIAVEPQSLNVKILRNTFNGLPEVEIVPMALGEAEGETEMFLASVDAVSSLSSEWISRTTENGRFKDVEWQNKETVKVTTLDKLIALYGKPSFIKIDVEGYEDHVLKGLSSPVTALSLEFVPEYLEPAVNSIHHLSSLGRLETNVAYGESLTLEFQEWISPDALISILEKVDRKTLQWGDIYIRFI